MLYSRGTHGAGTPNGDIAAPTVEDLATAHARDVADGELQGVAAAVIGGKEVDEAVAAVTLARGVLRLLYERRADRRLIAAAERARDAAEVSRDEALRELASFYHAEDALPLDDDDGLEVEAPRKPTREYK